MIDFKRRLERAGGLPREVGQRQRIRAILSSSPRRTVALVTASQIPEKTPMHHFFVRTESHRLLVLLSRTAIAPALHSTCPTSCKGKLIED